MSLFTDLTPLSGKVYLTHFFEVTRDPAKSQATEPPRSGWKLPDEDFLLLVFVSCGREPVLIRLVDASFDIEVLK